MKDENYYRKQLTGLLLIINYSGKDSFIARSYITEKLNMILHQSGINFHPTIKSTLDNMKVGFNEVIK